MIEPGEDPRRLEVALHAGQVGTTTETGIVELAKQPRLLQGGKAVAHPFIDHLVRPAHVAIFQQGDQVIARGPITIS